MRYQSEIIKYCNHINRFWYEVMFEMLFFCNHSLLPLPFKLILLKIKIDSYLSIEQAFIKHELERFSIYYEALDFYRSGLQNFRITLFFLFFLFRASFYLLRVYIFIFKT